VAQGPRLRMGAAGLSLACFAAVLTGVHLDAYKMASGVFRRGDLYSASDATMLFHRDGKTTTVSLMDFGTDRSLRTNGKSDGAINMDPDGPRVSDEITMTLTAAIPLAYRPDAASAAVIGIGTGLTTHTLLGSNALRSVETIEIEPAMAEASRRFRLAAAALSLACFAAVLTGVRLDPYKMASGVFRHGDLYTTREATMLSHRDGKTTTVSLMDFGSDRSLRTNGKSDGAINMDPNGPRVSDEVTMTLTAAIPLAYRPDAQSAAVIGIGTGLTTHTLLGSGTLRSVETIEIEPAMAETSRRFAPRNSNAFADPRSHIVFDDAKTFFSTHNRKYDIIISEPSNPWVSGVSSLFTAEFYRLVRRHLDADGVLVQWFQMYEIDASLVASVLRALGESFPDYAIYASTGSDLLIVAGETRALARSLADVTAMPGVARELRRVQVNSVRDLEVRRIGGKRALGPMFSSYGVPANSDYYPYLDLHAAKYRFLHQSADELTGLLVYSIPVVALLEGRKSAPADAGRGGQEYLEALETARRAAYARDYLISPNPPEPVAIPRQFQKDLELVRARLIECRDVGRSDIWFHSLYELARTLNPMLSADEAKAVWDRIERAPCSSHATPDERQWIGLMRAVGERAAPEMARSAEALLAKPSDLPGGHRQYLMAAGMAGYLAQGKRAEAAALWNRYPADADRTGDVGLRLLYAHAFATDQ